MFKVGDRVIPNNALTTSQQVAIVTEITDRGFKWKLEGDPICIHPLLGSYSDGECFEPGTYRLAKDDEKSIRLQTIMSIVQPRMAVAQWEKP